MFHWLSKFREFQRDVTNESRLVETVQRLAVDEDLSGDTADRLIRNIQETQLESQYIVKHLCAHLAIGLIFSFDLIPLPLGTLTRGAWVAGNRLFMTMRGQPERAKIHSWAVLLVSLIPFAGYFAYLIPLRAASADTAYLYANHVSYLRSGCSLRQYVVRKPAWQQRLFRNLLPSVLNQTTAVDK